MTITNIWITARNGDSEGFKTEIDNLLYNEYHKGHSDGYCDGYNDGWNSRASKYLDE